MQENSVATATLFSFFTSSFTQGNKVLSFVFNVNHLTALAPVFIRLPP